MRREQRTNRQVAGPRLAVETPPQAGKPPPTQAAPQAETSPPVEAPPRAAARAAPATSAAHAALAATSRRAVTVLAGCLILFAWLCLEVVQEDTRTIDDAILAWVVSQRTWALTTVAVNVTVLGSSNLLAVAAALVTVLFWKSGHRPAAVQTATACSAAALVTRATKVLVGRPRPALTERLLSVPGFSFPSGHTSGIAALLTATALHAIETAPSRGWRIVLVAAHAVLILAVGWSRVYLGVHHPADVLAGLCVGVACALGAHAMVRMPAIARRLQVRKG